MSIQVKDKKLISYLALIFAVFALGLSPILVQLSGAPGPVSSFYRLLVGALVMSWPFVMDVRKRGSLPRQGVWLAVLGGFFFALDMASWSTGVMLGDATSPTLLANTAPVWVGLGALIFFREKLNSRFWIGLLIAVFGAALVLSATTAEAPELGVGSLFGLLAAFFYGGYFLFVQRGRDFLSAFSFFWISALSSTIFLFIITRILHQPLLGYDTKTYLLFITMGVVAQAGGYFAITYASGHLPASLVSPTLLGQPVVSALLAMLVFGDQFTWLHVLGGVAVLGGVFIVHRSRS